MSKKKRYLEQAVNDLALDQKKMVFFSGARQTGKTTVAKNILPAKSAYFNWDDLDFKKLWTKSSTDLALQTIEKNKNPALILDEFHKNTKWKNQIKGFYDKFGEEIKIIVTGSAKLNAYKKGTDSLLGRFFHFNLHPFTWAELENQKTNRFKEFEDFIDSPGHFIRNKLNQSTVEHLFRMGGFPEPFLTGSAQFHRIWSRNRVELLIRQDLKEVSQIIQMGQVEILSSFLPLKIGSPLSVQSLKEDLDVAATTLARWLNALEQVYYHFTIRPYTKSIARSLKKEPKIYLYDWSVVENEGARFENMVASHLLKLVDYFNDTGQALLEIFYLRNKEKNEVDFLITSNKKPFFTVECKLNEEKIDQKHLVFQRQLRTPHFQITKKPEVFKKYPLGENKQFSYVISFAQFFTHGI